VILGVLLAGGLSVSSIIMSQQANSATNEHLDEIQQALLDFVKTQQRLPCVARLTVAPTHSDFGRELAASDCGGGATEIDGAQRVGGNVWIGAVPTRTLGLKDRMAEDAFGNRFLYAVTRDLTTNAGFAAAGNLGVIGVLDGSGALILDPDNGSIRGAAFMLLSHGPDGKGGVRHATGIGGTPCGTSTNLDVENCNATVNFRDTRFNNGTIPALFFDDFTRFMPKYRLTAPGTAGGGGLWGNTGDTIYSVGNDASTTTGNVGIGTATPAQNLHVTTPDLGFGNQTALQIGTGVGSLFLTHTGANISSNLRYDDGNWRYEAAGPGSVIEMGYDINFFTAPAGAAGAAVTPTERMRITSTGNVGIGTATPAARLDVAGETKIGNTNVACSGANEGSQRYNSTSKTMEFCNGTAWGAMGSVVKGLTIRGTTNSSSQSAPFSVSTVDSNTLLASNRSTSSITIVESGNYYLSAQQSTCIGGSDDFAGIIMRVNSVIMTSGVSHPQPCDSSSISSFLPLTAGNNVTVSCYHNTSTLTSCSFTVIKL
jgi:hypothetical protein